MGKFPRTNFVSSTQTTVLLTLCEVKENVEVYHKIWFEEATHLTTRFSTKLNLLRKYHRAQANLGKRLQFKLKFIMNLLCFHIIVKSKNKTTKMEVRSAKQKKITKPELKMS